MCASLGGSAFHKIGLGGTLRAFTLGGQGSTPSAAHINNKGRGYLVFAQQYPSQVPLVAMKARAHKPPIRPTVAAAFFLRTARCTASDVAMRTR